MSGRSVSALSQNQHTDLLNHELLNHERVRRTLRPQSLARLAIVIFVMCLGFSAAWAQNDVLTQHNDNTRSGLNANETVLTPANVTVSKFGRLFTHAVDGIIVGQPLYASNVLMNDGQMHNVVYVATQHNTVYAFDADSTQGSSASPLWSVSLNNGGTSDPISDYGCTGTHYTEIGIMSTPVIDPGKTTLYVLATANGDYDGPQASNDFSNSVLKMGWNGNILSVLDFFTPYNQLQLQQLDLDLGSSGPLVLPDQPGTYPHLLVAGGKEGRLYLINRDDMGKFTPDADNVTQSIPGAVVSELIGVPSYWNNNLYLAGEGDYIKQFSFVNGLLTQQPVSQTTMLFGGAGSASTSITANGNNNGILWAMRHTNPAALFAFDPTNLANKFYDSAQALMGRDNLVSVARFVTPTISNGKVYIGGKAALAAYGLLPSLSVGTGNNQTGMEKTVLPVALSVVATDAYASKPLVGIAVTCKDGGVRGVFTPSQPQTTDGTGTVTFSYRLPPSPRPVTITCASLGYTSAVFSETSAVGPPVRLVLASGNNQTAPPNTPLPASLVLKVLDAN